MEAYATQVRTGRRRYRHRRRRRLLPNNISTSLFVARRTSTEPNTRTNEQKERSEVHKDREYGTLLCRSFVLMLIQP